MQLETREFNAALKRLMKKTELSDGVVLRKVAFDLLSNILRPEPYGKHAVDMGQARAGWQVSAEALGKRADFKSRIKGEDKTAKGKAKGKYKEKLKGYNKFIEMINGVNHIVYLEYGHSKQSPLGMVRISMRKMRGKLPKELGKAYKKDWNLIMNRRASAFGSIAETIRDYTEFGD